MAFSSWPPNCLRIAESTLSAKSASPREVKRSYSAVVRTGAGTPSSIAAIEVQRPSPESETRPRELVEVRDCAQRRGGQVEQPGADHAAAPPHLGDLGEVDVVLVVLGVSQRRGLGVGLALVPCPRRRS